MAGREEQLLLNGVLFVKREDFLAVGGYDERIQTYIWSNENLYERLFLFGLERRTISSEHVKYIEHDDSLDTLRIATIATVQLSFNDILFSNVQVERWNDTWRHSEYTATDRANSVTIRAVFRPMSLRDTVSPDLYAESWSFALERLLHEYYHVPWKLMVGVSKERKEALVRRFLTWPPLSPKKRIFVCDCMHGWWSRLKALGSCMSFAKATERELIVIWRESRDMRADFTDIFFNTNIFVIREFSPTQPFINLENPDPTWKEFDFYNNLEKDGNGALYERKIIDASDRSIYFKGASAINAVHSLTNLEMDTINL